MVAAIFHVVAIGASVNSEFFHHASLKSISHCFFLLGCSPSLIVFIIPRIAWYVNKKIKKVTENRQKGDSFHRRIRPTIEP